jgi:glycosyltransferase involved in cell wall biosynthesis
MRKNILLFGHSYATQFVDISNQYTQLFDKNKYEVTVVYLVGEPDEKIRQKHVADKVIFLNSPKSSVRGLKISAIKEMSKLCREKNFEIVVCQRYKPTYIMMWVAQLVKIPAMFFVMHELGTLSHVSRKILIAALARQNMIFAGVSNAVRDDMRKDILRIPTERVITLYNMIDVEWTKSQLVDRQAAREQLNLPADAFVFGNIGRLAKNKDQKTLISAFAQIKSQVGNAKLIIIGDGILEAELKEQVKQANLTNDVIFTGFIANGFRFLPAFDVLISASIQEAFGRVLLEAMIAKTPIIATKVNGVPEVIGNTGPLIPAGDVQQMANEMLKAYQASQSERVEWGKKGFQRATQDFSLQRFNEIFWNLPIIQERVTT